MIRSGWEWWWRSGVDETDDEDPESMRLMVMHLVLICDRFLTQLAKKPLGLIEQNVDFGNERSMHPSQRDCMTSAVCGSFHVWRWYKFEGIPSKGIFSLRTLKMQIFQCVGSVWFLCCQPFFVCALLFALNRSFSWCSHSERLSLYLCKYKEQKQVDMWCGVHFCRRWWPCSGCSLGQSGSLHDCVVMTLKRQSFDKPNCELTEISEKLLWVYFFIHSYWKDWRYRFAWGPL